MNPEIVRPNLVGLGEVLWDVFPDAAHFGGAPANFACHAAGLGGDAWVVSAVGRDQLGDEALASLSVKNVHTLLLQRNEHPTGTVTVTLDAAKQASYVFAAEPAWDHIAWNASLALLAKKCQAVCFGSLAQRAPESRRTVREFLGFANVFKLNNDEVPVVADLLGLPKDEKAFVLAVAQRFDLHTVALTRGAAGSLVWHKGQYDEKTAPKVAVVDTVGAGDSFTAALAIGLLRDEDLSVIHQRAVDVAAFVCTKPGATPELLPEFRG